MRRLYITLGLLLGAIALAAGAAPAGDLVAHRGNDEARLSQAACTNEAILATIAPQARESYHQASGTIGGQAFTGCWRAMGDVAHIVWEDGDQGLVPFADLRPAMDI